MPKRKSTRIPLSRKFLIALATKHSASFSLLANIARERSRLKPYILQIRSYWKLLPQPMKADNDFWRKLHSTDDSNFQGAIAELFTAVTLRKTGFSIDYEPEISKKTPDFKIQKGGRAFFLETFCLGRSQDEIRTASLMNSFVREIKSVRAPHYLFLVAPPVPNASGNLAGLGKAIQRYLDSKPKPNASPDLDEYDRNTHWVSHNGALAGFHLTPRGRKGPVYFGASMGGRHGDPGVKALKKAIETKSKKYKFPILLSCVVDGDSDIDTYLTAIIGHPMFSIPMRKNGEPSKDVGITNANDGIWRSGGRAQKFDRVKGILFIKQRFFSDSGVTLEIHFVENPHSRDGTAQLFTNVPDLLTTSFQGLRSEIPGLKILPSYNSKN